MGESAAVGVGIHEKGRSPAPGKFGRHAYDLEKFGLSVDSLTPFFDAYLRRFAVQPEA